jgi:hypothetical protein
MLNQISNLFFIGQFSQLQQIGVCRIGRKENVCERLGIEIEHASILNSVIFGAATLANAHIWATLIPISLPARRENGRLASLTCRSAKCVAQRYVKFCILFAT